MATQSIPMQQATARLRIRQDAASTAAEIVGYVEAGSSFEPIAQMTGESVNGNAVWYELVGKKFVWSGASRALTETGPVAATPSAIKVNRRPDGTIRPLSQSEIIRVFGKFDHVPAKPRGAIRILNDWESRNIEPIDADVLSHIEIHSVKVHRLAKVPFQNVFEKIMSAGLQHLIISCAGTFVPRHMGWNPSRALSSHSWGIAIDINVAFNGYGVVPAAIGAPGSVRELVPIFASEGFAWGGHFQPQSLADGMHFELARIDL